MLLVPTGLEKKEDDSDSGKVWSRADEAREKQLDDIIFDPRFGDLTLRCVDEKSGSTLKDFLVNRVFLASASEVWRASFYGKFTEAKRGAVVEMRGVDPETLECLIRFAYFIDPKVNRLNAMPVRLLAERYQVTGLKRFCDSLLSEESLTPETVCEMLDAALKYDLKSLISASVTALEERFNSKDFEKLFKSKGFEQMTYGALCELLKSDRLRVKEEQLFEYLLKWADTQSGIAARAALAKAKATAEAATKAAAEEKTDETKTDEAFLTDIAASIPEDATPAVDPSMVLKKDPQSQDDFMQLVKRFIRFPVMDPKFLLTKVSETKTLTLEEEHAILKSIVMGTKFSPYGMEKRKGVWSFEDSMCFTRGTYGSSWGYGGSKDALCVQVSEEVALVAVGLWCPDAGCRAHIRIYDGENDRGDENCVMRYEEQTFPGPRNTTPVPYIFPEPFILEAGKKYTIELHQMNNSGSSYQTSSGTRTTITEGGVTLTISRARQSPNSTSPSSGALPCFWMCQ